MSTAAELGTAPAPALGVECVSAVRGLVIDCVEEAGNGHAGAALALAPLGCALFAEVLTHDPAEPSWPDRDRFVLSAGHASALLYSLLHVTGYALDVEDLRSFRRLGSRTPGHPEHRVTPGVETTTGPLGQGLATAVGMAVAERLAAARWNRPGLTVVDHHTVVVVGDGDLMEGVAQEAISLAGQWGLEKLIVCYDDNKVTIDGTTELSFDVEDQPRRFAASGWRVEHVADPEDVGAIVELLGRLKREPDGRPTLVIVPTIIGHPAEAVRGTPRAHGGPLGDVEARRTKSAMNLDASRTFTVPPAAAQRLDRRAEGAAARQAWLETFAAWSSRHPALRAEWDVAHGPTSAALLDDFELLDPGAPTSPRNASREVMDHLETRLPTMAGGAADLVDSTKTTFAGSAYFHRTAPARNLPFGVREHGMAAVTNGLALHGGVPRPYASTFLTFGDYMRPAVRLSALMGLPVVWIWTHDSIAIGADGATHQPVEHLGSLRAMPGLLVVRPADAHETVAAWRTTLDHAGPVALVLARHVLPTIDETSSRARDGVARGAYVLWESQPTGVPDLILLATGSEVHLVRSAATVLADEGIRVRVVSMPCWELFEQQTPRYRDLVLPPAVGARLGVEAGVSFGWHRWVGADGDILAQDGFGASDHGDVLLDHFGFTVTKVVERARAVLDRRKVGGRP